MTIMGLRWEKNEKNKTLAVAAKEEEEKLAKTHKSIDA